MVASYKDEYGNDVYLSFVDQRKKQAYLCTVFDDGKHRDLILFSINDKTFVSFEHDIVVSLHQNTITITKKIDIRNQEAKSFPLK